MLPTYLTEPGSIPSISEPAPGHLLEDLERRQDEVLAQLDDLEAKIASVLQGLNIDDESSDLD